MEAMKTIFVNGVQDNKNSPNIITIIRDLAFELSSKKLQNLSTEKGLQVKLERLLNVFIEALDQAELKNSHTVTAVIDGLIKAVSNDKKQYLLKTIYEKEQLEASIYKQSNDIKLLIAKTYDTIENSLQNISGDEKAQILQSLNDAKLLNVEILGILKEAAEEAFITTIEKARDIKDTAKEISKTFTYQAINEGKFTKTRVLNITSAIIEAARDIADSDHANANEILNGAIDGAKEGVFKAVAKIKNELKFAPDEAKEFLEQDTIESRKDMITIEESFIAMLKQCIANSEGISAKILSQIIAENDTYLAKLKRFSSEAAEILSVKLENFKEDGFKEFKEKAGKKFEEIKKDANEKVTAFKSDVEPKMKQMAQDTKTLGFRAWEAAKNALDDVVNKKKS